MGHFQSQVKSYLSADGVFKTLVRESDCCVLAVRFVKGSSNTSNIFLATCRIKMSHCKLKGVVALSLAKL